MAGDWIKIRVALRNDPKVIRMANWLAGQREFTQWLTWCASTQANCQESAYEHAAPTVTRHVTVALCVTGLISIWGMAREHGRREGDDLIIDDCDLGVLSAIADVPRLGDAMCHVGWAQETGGSQVTLPKFCRDCDMQSENAPNVTRDVTREVTSKSKSKSIYNPLGPLETLVQRWNKIPSVRHCRRITAARRTQYKARAKSPGWLDDVDEALGRVAASEFCGGANERSWRADIDWFLRPNTVTKLVEGAYDELGGVKQKSFVESEPPPLTAEEGAELNRKLMERNK